jgi:hypothetical protein
VVRWNEGLAVFAAIDLSIALIRSIGAFDETGEHLAAEPHCVLSRIGDDIRLKAKIASQLPGASGRVLRGDN